MPSNTLARPPIQVWVSFADNKLKTEVYNDAAPLSLVEIDKLFQPYSRLNSKSEGQGLGLAIAKQLTEQLGGEIGVIPAQKGNTFFFTIKNQNTPTVSTQENEPLTQEDIEAIRKYRLRVLLADDHALSRRVSVMLLEFFGCID